MIERKHWHPKLTDEKIFDAAVRQTRELEDPGFCVMCGHEQGGCEPDARRIKCEACGAKHVYGASELFEHLDGDMLDEMVFVRDPAKLWPTGGGNSD